MLEFNYVGFGRIRVVLSQIGGIISAVLSTLFAGFMVVGMILEDAVFSAGICLAIWAIIFGWTLSLTMFNAYPTVWVGDQGLAIRFLFRRILIPWDEIVDIRKVTSPPFGSHIVRARRITMFHRVYGLIYAKSLLPAFLVGRGIGNRDELLDEIRRRARGVQ